MEKLDLPKETILRIVISAVASELRDGCGRRLDIIETSSWDADTTFDETGLDLDSLELLACAGRVNQLFHMHETGIEDYLLRDRSFGKWAQIVKASLEAAGQRLTFLTSGSTGEPKPCTHEVDLLDQEIEAFVPLFARTKRIIACVPSHHIYGFLFTVLLPAKLNVPVLEGRFMSPGQWSQTLARDDLIISTPSFWRYLSQSQPAYPEGVVGLTSTAPMDRSLADTLVGQGLSRLVEIYGASETAGIGWRADPSDAYTLLAHWHRNEDGSLVRTRPNGITGEPVDAMDLLIWEPPRQGNASGPRQFRPAGRRDNAVQVGGINVFPTRISAVLCNHPSIEACAVHLVADGAVERLKAHIVLRDGLEASPAIVRDIEVWSRDHLSPAERPRLLCFDTSLPRTESGKREDRDRDDLHDTDHAPKALRA